VVKFFGFQKREQPTDATSGLDPARAKERRRKKKQAMGNHTRKGLFTDQKEGAPAFWESTFRRVLPAHKENGEQKREWKRKR